MELQITDKITISELQKQFSWEFPYLKIEFFDTPHSATNRLSKSHLYPASRILGGCRKIHKDGIISFTPNDTVEKLEQIFWEEFGLSVQIFRKSGNLWIETSLSNSWTLKLQNEEGRALSDGKFNFKKEDEDIADFDRRI